MLPTTAWHVKKKRNLAYIDPKAIKRMKMYVKAWLLTLNTVYWPSTVIITQEDCAAICVYISICLIITRIISCMEADRAKLFANVKTFLKIHKKIENSYEQKSSRFKPSLTLSVHFFYAVVGRLLVCSTQNVEYFSFRTACLRRSIAR